MWSATACRLQKIYQAMLNSLNTLPSVGNRIHETYMINIRFYESATTAYYNTYTSKHGVAVWHNNAYIYTMHAATSGQHVYNT